MAKVLNLDELSAKPAERELRIDGVYYPIPPMSVDNFIEATLAAERLEKSNNPADTFKETIDMIVRAVPGVPREKLGKYSLEVLGQIAAFVRGADVDEAEEKLAQAKAEVEQQAGK